MAVRLRSGELDRVEWRGYGQRLENLLPREHYRPVSRSPFDRPMGYGPDCLVCPVRAEDILDGNAHYPLTPVEFYQDLVRATRLKPVFIGQTSPNLYMDRLRAAFPDAEVRPPQSDVLVDFETIRQSRHVVVGVSTYAWLAAMFTNVPRFPRDRDAMLSVFDEDWYLSANPDAAQAGGGHPGSGLRHYLEHGFQEYRLPCRVDEGWYLTQYPLAGFELAQGDHFFGGRALRVDRAGAWKLVAWRGRVESLGWTAMTQRAATPLHAIAMRQRGLVLRVTFVEIDPSMPPRCVGGAIHEFLPKRRRRCRHAPT